MGVSPSASVDPGPSVLILQARQQLPQIRPTRGAARPDRICLRSIRPTHPTQAHEINHTVIITAMRLSACYGTLLPLRRRVKSTRTCSSQQITDAVARTRPSDAGVGTHDRLAPVDSPL